MPICLSKQSKFATNSPISFIFDFLSRHMSLDHNKTLRHKKISRFSFGEKNSFCLGLLARDIANHSYAQNTSLTQVLNPLSILKTLLQYAVIRLLQCDISWVEENLNWPLKRLFQLHSFVRPGTCFSKVPVTFRARKSCLVFVVFAFKIKISIILELMQWNCK